MNFCGKTRSLIRNHFVFRYFFACFLFKRRISPVSSNFQQITWAIFSGYTPWLVEHAGHALLPEHDNADFVAKPARLTAKSAFNDVNALEWLIYCVAIAAQLTVFSSPPCPECRFWYPALSKLRDASGCHRPCRHEADFPARFQPYPAAPAWIDCHAGWLRLSPPRFSVFQIQSKKTHDMQGGVSHAFNRYHSDHHAIGQPAAFWITAIRGKQDGLWCIANGDLVTPAIAWLDRAAVLVGRSMLVKHIAIYWKYKVLLAVWAVWGIVGIMWLRKVSLAASNRNAANGDTTKPSMEHNRIYCSISLCFITAKDCIHVWIAKTQTNMKRWEWWELLNWGVRFCLIKSFLSLCRRQVIAIWGIVVVSFEEINLA